MDEKTPLQTLGEETRPLFVKFWREIQPYQSELWSYCRKLTGNPWDAEDLFQDTTLKMFTSLSALSHRMQPIHPRAWLFRVATNHWIDVCRKRKVRFEEWSDNLPDTVTPGPSVEIRGAFEALLEHLPPRQTAILVLVDAFRFTGREAAEILGTTEGAVHSALYRARALLREIASRENAQHSASAAGTVPAPALVDRYVTCFNRRDFRGIADLLAEHAVYSFVTQSSKEYGKNTIMNASHNPERGRPDDLRAVVRELWGRPAVVVFKVSGDGVPVALVDVMTIETEDNRIVGINCYFFCPQFMAAAAVELGLPRDDWQWAE